MNKVILKIDGMSCSACSSGLEKYLNSKNGIINASVNLVLAQALIEYEDNIKLSDIETFIKEAGFTSLGIYNSNNEEKSNDNKKYNLIIFAVLSIFILYISMSHMIGLPTIKYLSMNTYPINYSICLFTLTILFLIYGKDIFISGIKNLIHKMPNMDTLVTLGVFSNFIYSSYNMFMIFLGFNNYVENLYFESCAIIIFFIKLGRYIDSKNKEKTKEAIKQLVQITPNTATLKVNNSEKIVTIDEIKKGDIVISKPGDKIAVDGTIIKGEAHFDEAFITGESVPIKKKKNEKVIAGSLNQDGYIEYKAEKIGKDSTISEIVRLVVEATNTKAPIAKLADTVSSYFVPCIIVISIITLVVYLLLGFEFKEAITSFVSVLVVACPCALGLATPLAIVVGEGLCIKNGILVKSSEILENAHKVDTIVFDKTGTLTFGNLKISKIINYGKYTDKELIKIVSSIEKNSNHPIANTFKKYVKDNNVKILNVSDFKNISGIGIYSKVNKKDIYIGNSKLFSKLKLENKYIADEEKLSNDGNSIIYVIESNKVIGIIGVKDIVRDGTKKVINQLKKLNKNVIMLTGDNEKSANIIAKSIDIENVIANVLPKEKTNVIKDLLKNNKNVMMVGDGINDAPSLATANIGVSISGATDVASDSSDVILMNDNLGKIITLMKISQKTIRNIKQNLFWAFFYNICMIPVAIGIFKPYGIYLNPMLAGLAMTISSLTVVFNALRLKRWKEK